MKTAIFSCLGLGDGLISLVLANNLHRAGDEVHFFHPSMASLQEWFPWIIFGSFPPNLEEFDRGFLFYENTPWMQEIVGTWPATKLTILNPIPTLKNDYPYWEQGRFEGNRSFVENLYVFCRDMLKLPEPTQSNGIVIPQGVIPRQYPGRVVIHPTSSRPGKNWPQEKFLKLARALEKKGFDPQFALSPSEQRDWPTSAPSFKNLSELAAFVCASGAMIGNDSGIGHLASCLGLPTVTICRKPLGGNFWRPSWSPGAILYPPQWIPNLKGIRLRDRHWKQWISTRRVLKAFHDLKIEIKIKD